MSLEQYKDATRKELWEILQIQVERIGELEEERVTLKKFIAFQGEVVENSDAELVEKDKRIGELEEERAVRDLEQQAKGLEDYVSKTMDNSYILHLDPEDIHHCILINLNATALRLLERAKALKEQE